MSVTDRIVHGIIGHKWTLALVHEDSLIHYTDDEVSFSVSEANENTCLILVNTIELMELGYLRVERMKTVLKGLPVFAVKAIQCILEGSSAITASQSA